MIKYEKSKFFHPMDVSKLNTKWKDIIGNDKAKEEIKNVFRLEKFNKLFKK